MNKTSTPTIDAEIAFAMKKMPPVEIRKVMELIKAYTTHGVWFYPVPAVSPEDFVRLHNESNEKLAVLLNHFENTKQ
ncbi:MAG: DUF1382 family protein [Methylococcaceae bacterium]